jgi:hypothetical protein
MAYLKWRAQTVRSALVRGLSRGAMSRDLDRVRILKAKYMDWCSAKLADRFLQLTPDAIYELALEASREDPVRPATGDGGIAVPSYRAIVGRVADVLSERLALPAFEEWSVAYEAAPEQFDHELLGLWKEGAPV